LKNAFNLILTLIISFCHWCGRRLLSYFGAFTDFTNQQSSHCAHRSLWKKMRNVPGSTPLSIGCTSPIFCSRVRCLNPTSIGLPMSILMSRCKTSKWVRLTAVFKRLKFKQKEKKETFLDGRETTFFGVVLQCSTHYTTLYYFLTVFCSTALN
jgi:hypothetical protein